MASTPCSSYNSVFFVIFLVTQAGLVASTPSASEASKSAGKAPGPRMRGASQSRWEEDMADEHDATSEPSHHDALEEEAPVWAEEEDSELQSAEGSDFWDSLAEAEQDEHSTPLEQDEHSTPLEQDGTVFTIPLDKQYVPVIKNNVTVMHKTAYFGTIYVGSPVPQPFSMLFDTGSGHLFIPSGKCEATSCKKRRQYNRDISITAVDIDHDGNEVPLATEDSERDKVAVEYGTGEVEGDFVYELACLTDHTGEESYSESSDCAMLRVITTTQMSDEPFQSFAFDGVVGLGLASLAVHPEFSFFGQVAKAHRLQHLRFGVFLSGDDAVASEISFGGHDPRRVASELSWAPVSQPELGYWQIHLPRVTVGGEPFALCEDGGCLAVVDTGTSLLGIPKQELSNFHWLLARRVLDGSENLDCREFPGPEVVFHFDGFNITVGPEDYSRPSALRIENSKTNKTDIICRSSLLPVSMPEGMGVKTWILGEPALRKYYTTYDWAEQQVGFALAVPPPPSAEPRHTIFGQPPAKATRSASVVTV